MSRDGPKPSYLLLDSVLNLGQLSLEHEVPEPHFLQLCVPQSLLLGVVCQQPVGNGPPSLAVLSSLGHLGQEVAEGAAQLLAPLQLLLQACLGSERTSSATQG